MYIVILRTREHGEFALKTKNRPSEEQIKKAKEAVCGLQLWTWSSLALTRLHQLAANAKDEAVLRIVGTTNFFDRSIANPFDSLLGTTNRSQHEVLRAAILAAKADGYWPELRRLIATVTSPDDKERTMLKRLRAGVHLDRLEIHRYWGRPITQALNAVLSQDVGQLLTKYGSTTDGVNPYDRSADNPFFRFGVVRHSSNGEAGKVAGAISEANANGYGAEFIECFRAEVKDRLTQLKT